MALTRFALGAAEQLPLPDAVLRAGIRTLVERTRQRLAAEPDDRDERFAQAMDAFPIAIHTADANTQHYEVPAAFFELVLGPHLKYSSCLYPNGTETLAEAELCALAETAAHAALADGQTILELGCGWGSLSLYMAETYPNAQVTAVSNSASQRAHIEAKAAERGLGNLQILTRNMVEFEIDQRFDRIVSVEMFEHMSNWRALLDRMRGWLKPDGRAFLHVFSHRLAPYRFRHDDPDDWIAQHFFTGGIMPSHTLIRQFADLFTVEEEWFWNGRHYERTALHWLTNMDRNDATVRGILSQTYGADAALWRRRWRLFFLAVAGLFGHREGTEWGVSHYRLAPR